ncbi:uncharacterized protein LOC123924740 [Trifolium pratense]|uniref:uncharacterized protein LOC123924740 n=1 Tax=Trifolium pratense TaxID=57577 RepID=UPI001E691684|nr:uncharacterized protein LOC123924740 [Trifolium pratense]
MDVPANREWMYNRVLPDGVGLTNTFYEGVEFFILHACGLDQFKNEGTIRCPCLICDCRRSKTPNEVMNHLYKKGFRKNYFYWTSHGEERPASIPITHPPPSVYGRSGCGENLRSYERMVMDAAGPSFADNHEQSMEETPNDKTQAFFDLLSAAQSPLFEGCTSHSELSASLQLLTIKAEHNISQEAFNKIVDFCKEALPSDNCMPPNYYRQKKMVERLSLNYEKIDCCVNGCMLFYNHDINEKSCRFCKEERYTLKKTSCNKVKEVARKRMWYLPLAPRLQRLNASPATSSNMRWHAENVPEDGVLIHPSDGEAWKHFDRTYPNFAAETRNVRLGLCSDGFSPFNISGKPYSCWPVIVTPYNLPPSMCMKEEYLFLTLIIPGPKNPKGKIDVFLQPLIDELKLLWHTGVTTYDVSLSQNFQMKAALMWTINDFPTYGMLSGWSTAGKLSCPYCMEQTKGKILTYGKKASFFDCHRRFLPMDHPYRRNKNNFTKNKQEYAPPPQFRCGDEVWERVSVIPKAPESELRRPDDYGEKHHWTKQSIFWDLPYWRTNLIRHNLDVMHVEKNVFDNVFYTVMDIKEKTKDNVKARRDIHDLCRRPELELVDLGNGKVKKPTALYTLSASQRKCVCEWVLQLKFPDGYASNIRKCVDLRTGKLLGMKSHDCHIFMERLLLVAFSSLPEKIWNPLVELSHFFRELCSTTLKADHLEQMEKKYANHIVQVRTNISPGFLQLNGTRTNSLSIRSKTGRACALSLDVSV